MSAGRGCVQPGVSLPMCAAAPQQSTRPSYLGRQDSGKGREAERIGKVSRDGGYGTQDTVGCQSRVQGLFLAHEIAQKDSLEPETAEYPGRVGHPSTALAADSPQHAMVPLVESAAKAVSVVTIMTHTPEVGTLPFAAQTVDTCPETLSLQMLPSMLSAA